MPRRARVGPTRILARGGVILFWSIFIALVITTAAWTFVGFRDQRAVADHEVRIETLEWRVDGLVDYCLELNRYFAGEDSVAWSPQYIDPAWRARYSVYKWWMPSFNYPRAGSFYVSPMDTLSLDTE